MRCATALSAAGPMRPQRAAPRRGSSSGNEAARNAS